MIVYIPLPFFPHISCILSGCGRLVSHSQIFPVHGVFSLAHHGVSGRPLVRGRMLMAWFWISLAHCIRWIATRGAYTGCCNVFQYLQIAGFPAGFGEGCWSRISARGVWLFWMAIQVPAGTFIWTALFSRISPYENSCFGCVAEAYRDIGSFGVMAVTLHTWYNGYICSATRQPHLLPHSCHAQR